MKLTFHAPTNGIALTEIKKRVAERVAHLDRRYPRFEISTRYHWVSDRTAEGEYRGGKGRVTVGEETIDAELELPFFARPFRARIEAFVQRELAGMLAGERPSRVPPPG
jgi:hypothetical protein